MLRPWMLPYGTHAEDHYALGDGAWARRLPAPVLTAGARPSAALTAAQKRKASNLFAEARAARTAVSLTRALSASARTQLTACEGGDNAAAVTGRVLSAESCFNALATRHLAASGAPADAAHALAAAARAWFASFAALRPSDGDDAECRVERPLTHGDFMAAVAMLLSQEPPEEAPGALPEWLLAPFVEQFTLALGEAADANAAVGMNKPTFVAWCTRTRRCTPAQLRRATRTDGVGDAAPSLEQVFAAADAGRKGMLTPADWRRLVVRFWTCSEPWDELNAFSL